ncbi:MAG: class I SAM-dependent methyltransferase [Acidobacteria bacterium]|nr:class I SAM-dependent methyltransferase [Acidobacteriota bacterium]
MSASKSDKELAFLHDLYVSTDWGERFAELVSEHVGLPAEGRALYVASGTGAHALALLQRAGKDVTMICVDESAERMELARAKAIALKLDERAEFRATQLEALQFEDDQFDLVIGDASMVAPERVPEMLAEMVRVAAPGGTVALNLTTASSFGEFFSIYWEALANAGLAEHGSAVEAFISELPTVSEIERMAEREGLDDAQSWTQKEEFDYASGEEFLNSPLITDFLLPNWLEPLPDEEARAQVAQEIARIIDEERSEAEFALSIKATLVTGRKAD